MSRQVKKIDPTRLPECVRMRIATMVYKWVLEDYQKPEFQEGFKRWKEEQAAKAAGGASDGR